MIADSSAQIPSALAATNFSTTYIFRQQQEQIYVQADTPMSTPGDDMLDGSDCDASSLASGFVIAPKMCADNGDLEGDHNVECSKEDVEKGYEEARENTESYATYSLEQRMEQTLEEKRQVDMELQQTEIDVPRVQLILPVSFVLPPHIIPVPVCIDSSRSGNIQQRPVSLFPDIATVEDVPEPLIDCNSDNIVNDLSRMRLPNETVSARHEQLPLRVLSLFDQSVCGAIMTSEDDLAYYYGSLNDFLGRLKEVLAISNDISISFERLKGLIIHEETNLGQENTLERFQALQDVLEAVKQPSGVKEGNVAKNDQRQEQDDTDELPLVIRLIVHEQSTKAILSQLLEQAHYAQSDPDEHCSESWYSGDATDTIDEDKEQEQEAESGEEYQQEKQEEGATIEIYEAVVDTVEESKDGNDLISYVTATPVYDESAGVDYGDIRENIDANVSDQVGMVNVVYSPTTPAVILIKRAFVDDIGAEASDTTNTKRVRA